VARLPQYVESGGGLSATYVYVANSYGGSMAVTAAATPIRIVCANTLYPNVWVKGVIRTRVLSEVAECWSGAH
jgi:hypothetical protein